MTTCAWACKKDAGLTRDTEQRVRRVRRVLACQSAISNSAKRNLTPFNPWHDSFYWECNNRCLLAAQKLTYLSTQNPRPPLSNDNF